MTTSDDALPNRLAARQAVRDASAAVAFDPALDRRNPVRRELAALRHRVPGVTGCIVAGVDGLLILHDSRTAGEPHDVAATAAAVHRMSLTCGSALDQGDLQEVTIRNRDGCLAVYAVGEPALLAVVGDGTVNVALLHREAGPVLARLAELL